MLMVPARTDVLLETNRKRQRQRIQKPRISGNLVPMCPSPNRDSETRVIPKNSGGLKSMPCFVALQMAVMSGRRDRYTVRSSSYQKSFWEARKHVAIRYRVENKKRIKY